MSDGATLRYELAGDGPTVTLIHPGLWDMRTWDREFRTFPGSGFRVLRYDVRGYGRSTRVEAGTTYSHVRDLDALLEAAEITQTALVGCSMGGAIALDFTLEHPERVWALVLVASAVDGFETTEEENEWWAERDGSIEALIEAGSLEEAQERRLEIWAPLGTADPAGARIREIAFDNLHEIVMDESGEERPDPPAAHRLAEIDVPTLILEAEHDPPDMRRVAEFLAREIMGSKRVVVEGADHVLNMRQPERFEDLVLPFLADATP